MTAMEERFHVRVFDECEFVDHFEEKKILNVQCVAGVLDYLRRIHVCAVAACPTEEAKPKNETAQNSSAHTIVRRLKDRTMIREDKVTFITPSQVRVCPPLFVYGQRINIFFFAHIF